MRAAIYTRVSQPGRGLSHEQQYRLGVQTCRDLGLEVGEQYADTGMSRGEVLRMLEDLRADCFEVIVVDRVSRFPHEVDVQQRTAMAGGRLVDSAGIDTAASPAAQWAAQARHLADAALAEQRGELHLLS